MSCLDRPCDIISVPVYTKDLGF